MDDPKVYMNINKDDSHSIFYDDDDEITILLHKI